MKRVLKDFQKKGEPQLPENNVLLLDKQKEEAVK